MLSLSHVLSKCCRVCLPNSPIALSAQYLHTSTVLNKSPVRRKKTGVSEMQKSREERKVFRLTRNLRHAEQRDRILKPIEEVELDGSIAAEIERRIRPQEQIDETEAERRALLLKEWNRYSRKVHCEESRRIKHMIQSQERALKALKRESQYLYEKALEVEPPFEHIFHGPTETPPLEDYLAPDGSYSNANKNWDMDPCPLTSGYVFAVLQVSAWIKPGGTDLEHQCNKGIVNKPMNQSIFVSPYLTLQALCIDHFEKMTIEWEAFS